MRVWALSMAGACTSLFPFLCGLPAIQSHPQLCCRNVTCAYQDRYLSRLSIDRMTILVVSFMRCSRHLSRWHTHKGEGHHSISLLRYCGFRRTFPCRLPCPKLSSCQRPRPPHLFLGLGLPQRSHGPALLFIRIPTPFSSD